MFATATDENTFTLRFGSVTVNSSAPVAPFRARSCPTSNTPPVDGVDANTTSGMPSPSRSITAGVFATFREDGSTLLLVQDHSRTGLNGPGVGTNEQLAPELFILFVSFASTITLLLSANA